MAATNSNDSVKQQLQLQGVVRYTLPRSNHLAAKWLSTRMIDRFDEAGHGSAERLDPSTLEEVEREISVDDMQGLDDAAGTWRISYFEPGSEVAAVTPVGLPRHLPWAKADRRTHSMYVGF